MLRCEDCRLRHVRRRGDRLGGVAAGGIGVGCCGGRLADSLVGTCVSLGLAGHTAADTDRVAAAVSAGQAGLQAGRAE
eukprot:scaffold294255_cov35-Prasinocladus_malaysianus.AAC.1